MITPHDRYETSCNWRLSTTKGPTRARRCWRPITLVAGRLLLLWRRIPSGLTLYLRFGMHFYCFLLVVVSLCCGSLPAVDVDPLRAAAASVGLVSGWILLCHVAARITARQVTTSGIDQRLAAEWLDVQLETFRWLGLGVAVLCLGGFGLAGALDSIWLLEQSMFLQACVLLLPATLITIGTWSAEHRYGVRLGYTEPGLGNQFRSVASCCRSCMAWLIVPILLLLAAGDAIAWLPLDPITAGWVTAVAAILFIPLGLPALMRYFFKSRPLDGPTERWIRQLLAAAGVRSIRSAHWDTGGKNFNALVVGFVPWLRTLLISDRLLAELPRSQIAMVILHEAAHVRRRHVPLRMLAVVPAWVLAALSSMLAGDANWATPLGTILGILFTVLALRLVAYRTEYDADHVACRLAAGMAGEVEEVPSSYEAAAGTLGQALERVTEDHPAAQRRTWLHPSVADRRASMRRHLADPIASNSTAGTIANPA